MACHTPSLKKAMKQGKIPIPSLFFFQKIITNANGRHPGLCSATTQLQLKRWTFLGVCKETV